MRPKLLSFCIFSTLLPVTIVHHQWRAEDTRGQIGSHFWVTDTYQKSTLLKKTAVSVENHRYKQDKVGKKYYIEQEVNDQFLVNCQFLLLLCFYHLHVK